MLYLVTGPPAAGKTTWVRQRAKHGDITIDYDAIASTLTPQAHDRVLPQAVSTVTRAARRAAIDAALEYRDTVDVYVIHAMPSERMLALYRRMGARVVVVDPGESVVMARCRDERPWQMGQAAKRWYQNPRPTPTAGEVAMPW